MPKTPGQIGAYTLIDTVGEGGMAVVFRARQTEPVKREVALKILKRGMDSEEVVRRFEAERQTLAMLDHPHIANIFDGGLSDDGQPYFVMEYIDGRPIVEYCDAERLSLDARLELFLDLCAAVQHAHIKGVIHRDLKPSNILVTTRDGRPWLTVIDFGIAKWVAEQASAEDGLTRTGRVPGTPQYMSPEQFAGAPIDSRADIYALGVVLYELLAGCLPIDFSGATPQAYPYLVNEKTAPALDKAFCEAGEARRAIAASRRLTERALERELAGDLRLICAVTLNKDPALRYETAHALAEDLRCFRTHQPIAARRPSSAYLLRQFVRRNTLVVAAAATVFVALGAGVIVAGYGLVEARRSEQAALREAERAGRVSDFLVGLFEISDPSESRGNSVTAREMLDAAAVDIDHTLAGEPEIRANLMNTMAQVYANLGLYPEAGDLAETALEVRRDLDSDGTALADSLDQLGSIRAQLGALQDARALHEEALAIRERVAEPATSATVNTLQHLAVVAYLQSDFEGAREYFLRGLELADAAPEPDVALLADLTGNLGVIHDQLNDLEQAERFKRRAVASFDALHGRMHPLSATARNNLAITLNRRRKTEDAAAMYREVLDTYRTLYDGPHPNTANTLNNLALVLIELNALEEAERAQRESLAMFREVFGDAHTQVGTASVNLGRVLAAADRHAEAEQQQRIGLEVQAAALAPGHQRIFVAREALAASLIGQQKFAEGEEQARLAWQYFRDRYGYDHWRTARAGVVLADALIGQKKYEAAEDHLDAALPLVAAALGDDHPATLQTIDTQITLYEATGRSEEAEQLRAGLENQ